MKRNQDRQIEVIELTVLKSIHSVYVSKLPKVS